jgi:hypothetical protein
LWTVFAGFELHVGFLSFHITAELVISGMTSRKLQSAMQKTQWVVCPQRQYIYNAVRDGIKIPS